MKKYINDLLLDLLKKGLVNTTNRNGDHTEYILDSNHEYDIASTADFISKGILNGNFSYFNAPFTPYMINDTIYIVWESLEDKERYIRDNITVYEQALNWEFSKIDINHNAVSFEEFLRKDNIEFLIVVQYPNGRIRCKCTCIPSDININKKWGKDYLNWSDTDGNHSVLLQKGYKDMYKLESYEDYLVTVFHKN